MVETAKLRGLTERVLRTFPEFEIEDNPADTREGWRVGIRRKRNAYGTFADTDRIRQVQRELLSYIRNSDYRASLGRETKDSFNIVVKPPITEKPINLHEEVVRVIREREDSNQMIAPIAVKHTATD